MTAAAGGSLAKIRIAGRLIAAAIAEFGPVRDNARR
jgi:hypothetical protein